jgi:hypothetical protein
VLEGSRGCPGHGYVVSVHSSRTCREMRHTEGEH